MQYNKAAPKRYVALNVKDRATPLITPNPTKLLAREINSSCIPMLPGVNLINQEDE